MPPAQPIQPRVRFDQLGFPTSRIQRWTEDWSNVGLVNKSASNGAWAGRWNYGVENAGVNTGLLSIAAAGISGAALPASPRAVLEVTGASATSVLIEHGRDPAFVTADTAITMQWDAVSLDSAVNNGEQAMGLKSGSLAAVATALPSPSLVGAYFYSSAADPTWFAYYKIQGGSRVGIDTGVSNAIDARHRFAIQIMGANQSPDGAPRIIFYIDGNVIPNGNVGVDMAGGGGAGLGPYFWERGLAARRSSIGVVDFAANLETGDVWL